MIEKFEFNGETFNKGDVTAEVPEKIKWAISSVKPVANKCLANSGKMAQETGAKMVEGYLITTYHDKEQVECVGHVWNEYHGIQFDISASLINDETVKDNTYFPHKTYLVADALRQANPFPFGPEHVVFSTRVKNNEKKVREHLNSNPDTAVVE